MPPPPRLPWVLTRDQDQKPCPAPFLVPPAGRALCSERLFGSVLLQMRTARTGTSTATWWSRRGCASTTTTRPPAAPPAPAGPTGTRASWAADNPPRCSRGAGQGGGGGGAGCSTRGSGPPHRAASRRRHHPHLRESAHVEPGAKPRLSCSIAINRRSLLQEPAKVLSEPRRWGARSSPTAPAPASTS